MGGVTSILMSDLARVAVTLLKNLSDHKVRSSETATVGHAQKFVGSRNPVTLIVNIEILTGGPPMDAA